MGYTRKEVATVTHGTINKMGTDWPIETCVHRIKEGTHKPYWLVTYNLCMGIPTGSKRFSTLTAAMAELPCFNA